MKIVLELFDSISGNYREVHLPMTDVARLKTFGNPCFDDNIFITSFNSSFPYKPESNENIMLLNNILLKIAILSDSQKARVKDFYSLSDEKDILALQTAYNSRLSYETFDPKELNMSTEETQQKLGEYFLLQLVPDIMIALDGFGILSEEDAALGYHIGVRSGAIKFKDGKYYVFDRSLITQCTNADLDMIEQIESYEGGV